jgi:hypothetical protein
MRYPIKEEKHVVLPPCHCSATHTLWNGRIGEIRPLIL